MENFNGLESEEFIRAVDNATKHGFGFAVLFGSGMSAPAGIIMGMQFSGYLAYCVNLAVDKNLDKNWDFRRNGWPPYPSTKEYNDSLSWVLGNFRALCERSGYRVIADQQNDLLVANLEINHPSGPSLFTALNCPPVPAAIRSPNYYGSEGRVRMLAKTLRSANSNSLPYEPLWPHSEVSPSSESYLVELAIRSLSDWRNTLHFLSRVVQRPNRAPLLETPDNQVVDRFNSFITADKQPALGHKMLVHLARPLRIRTILTTNFDTLIEEAFLQMEMPLTKIPVSKEGRLPDPFEVVSRMSIIKMHGEAAETRADLTLDEEPDEEDKRRFLGYFVDIDEIRQDHRRVPSHLLVAGFSASDLRIVRFVQHLLDSTRHLRHDLRPKIFWICFTLADVNRIAHYFSADEYRARVLIHQSVRPDLLLHELYQKVTLSLPSGGLTYEYSHNVPPNRYGDQRFDDAPKSDLRATFDKAAHSIQGVLRDAGPTAVATIREARDQLSQIVGLSIVENAFSGKRNTEEYCEVRDLYRVCNGGDYKGPAQYSLAVASACPVAQAAITPGCCGKFDASAPSQPIIAFDMPFGVLEAFSIPYNHSLNHVGKQCLWFEMADYLDADSFLRDVLRAITLRLGRFQREQVTLHPLCVQLHDSTEVSPEETTRRLCGYLTIMCQTYHLTPSDWSLFIYGREVAGSCVGWLGSSWGKGDWANLATVLRAFATAGFHVVLSPPSHIRVQRERGKWEEHVQHHAEKECLDSACEQDIDVSEYNAFVRNYAVCESLIPDTRELPYEGETSGAGSKLTLFDAMIRALDQESQRYPGFEDFFYAVTLFRQSRRPSSLFYEGVQTCPRRFNLIGIDNDLIRSNDAAAWTQFLRTERIFYNKPGGHLWMHRDLRLIARARLDRKPWIIESSKTVRYRGQSLGRLHFWIGDWYYKAFCSTGFVLPIIECLHHRFQAALAAPYARPSNLNEPTRDPSALGSLGIYRFSLIRSAILELRKNVSSN